MFTKKLRLGITATVAAAALALSGCGGGGDAGSGDATPNELDGAYEVASDVNLSGSPTFDKMKSADKVIIGVKEDQPGMGYKDIVSGKYEGFDIEIAKWLAASLGFGEDKIEYKTIPSANREQAIKNGDVDFYVGTYSITDKRKQEINFAGPYFQTGQGLLVKRDNEEITSDQDLSGKTVCSVTGSTPIQNIRENYPDAKATEFDVYQKCVDALINGDVDAVTTDEAILIGYASVDPDNLKVVGDPFTVEKYGVGLPKGDDALKEHFNTTFSDGGEVWTKIFNATLGKSGAEVKQPEIEP